VLKGVSQMKLAVRMAALDQVEKIVVLEKIREQPSDAVIRMEATNMYAS